MFSREILRITRKYEIIFVQHTYVGSLELSAKNWSPEDGFIASWTTT